MNKIKDIEIKFTDHNNHPCVFVFGTAYKRKGSVINLSASENQILQVRAEIEELLSTLLLK